MKEFIGIYVLGFAPDVEAKDLTEKAESFHQGSRDFDYLVLRLEDILYLKHIHEGKFWKLGTGNNPKAPDLAIYGILCWGTTPRSLLDSVGHIIG
jgi:hypothetical protein